MSLDLGTAIGSLRKGWPYVVVGILAAVAMAAGIQRLQDPVYASEGTYLVAPSATDPDVVENIKTLDATRSRSILTTLTEIMASDAVLANAGAAAGIGDTADYGVRASVLPEANGVTLRVEGPDPVLSATLAERVAATAAQRFVALYRVYDVSILDAPEVATSPAGRTLVELLVLAGILGLAVGVAIALLTGGDSAGSKRSGVSSRLGAYGTNVTPIRGSNRRAG